MRTPPVDNHYIINGKTKHPTDRLGEFLVEVTGFEPATFWSRNSSDTQLLCNWFKYSMLHCGYIVRFAISQTDFQSLLII